MTTIQWWRELDNYWVSVNPIPATGEFCYSIDTYEIRLGDGTLPWSELNIIGYGGPA